VQQPKKKQGITAQILKQQEEFGREFDEKQRMIDSKHSNLRANGGSLGPIIETICRARNQGVPLSWIKRQLELAIENYTPS